MKEDFEKEVIPSSLALAVHNQPPYDQHAQRITSKQTTAYKRIDKTRSWPNHDIQLHEQDKPHKQTSRNTQRLEY